MNFNYGSTSSPFCNITSPLWSSQSSSLDSILKPISTSFSTCPAPSPLDSILKPCTSPFISCISPAPAPFNTGDLMRDTFNKTHESLSFKIPEIKLSPIEPLKLDPIETPRAKHFEEMYKCMTDVKCAETFTNDPEPKGQVIRVHNYTNEPSHTEPSTTEIAQQGVLTNMVQNGQDVISRVAISSMTQPSVPQGIIAGARELGKSAYESAADSIAQDALAVPSVRAEPCSISGFTSSVVNGAIVGGAVSLSTAVPSMTVEAAAGAFIPAAIHGAVATSVGAITGSVANATINAIECQQQTNMDTLFYDHDAEEAESLGIYTNAPLE